MVAADNIKAINVANAGNLTKAIRSYNLTLRNSIHIDEYVQIALTPDKPYLGRAEAQVTVTGTNEKIVIGTMYILAMKPGDGTGNMSTYRAGDLVIQDRHRFEEQPARVYPRSKDGTVAEGFFPLLSVIDGGVYPFAACLEELVVEDKKLKVGYVLGGGYDNFNFNASASVPQIQLTTGCTPTGIRFGDPHAIHYPCNVFTNNAIQIVGFLATDDPRGPIANALDIHGNLPTLSEGLSRYI